MDRGRQGVRHRKKFQKLLVAIKLFYSGIIQRRNIFESNWASATMLLYRACKQREEDPRTATSIP